MDKSKDDKITVDKKSVKIVDDIVKDVFNLMLLDVEYDVSHDKDADAIVVNIKSEENAGLLIGKKGETINALQTIISTISRKKMNGWVRVFVNVSDWREKQNQRIIDLALKVSERVKQTGEPQNLYNLNASERRLIHLTLAEDKDVVTESTGEGKDRFISIKLTK